MSRKICEASTQICSNQLVVRYGVNGSEKEGQTFYICGPCAVYLKRGGSKLKSVKGPTLPGKENS